MKMNNKKIIVSTLALAMGAALAGSVSGTVAWFQYSTRAQAAYVGATAHCSEALEVKAVGKTSSAWGTDLKAKDVVAKDGYGSTLEPITTGELGEAVALNKTTGDNPIEKFYKNPIYQYADQSTWSTATKDNFVQFDLKFHVKDIDGKSTTKYLDKHNLYLSNLSIVSLNATESGDVTNYSDISSTNDLYKAIRVHLSAGTYEKTFAFDSAVDGNIETDTYGKLDLNNDGALDKTAGYEWTTGAADIEYGKVTGEGATNKQVAYNAAKAGVLADDSDPALIASKAGTAGLIGAIDDAEDGLTVTVTIWLEGWQKLNIAQVGNAADAEGNTDNSAIWDPATYIGKHFGVGFRFATELHGVDAEHGA